MTWCSWNVFVGLPMCLHRSTQTASMQRRHFCEYLPNGHAAMNWWTTLSLAQFVGNWTPSNSVSSRAFGIFVWPIGSWLLDWLNIVKTKTDVEQACLNAMNIYEPLKPNKVQDQLSISVITSRLCHWFILLEFAPRSGIQGAVVEVIWKKTTKRNQKTRRI